MGRGQGEEQGRTVEGVSCGDDRPPRGQGMGMYTHAQTLVYNPNPNKNNNNNKKEKCIN